MAASANIVRSVVDAGPTAGDRKVEEYIPEHHCGVMGRLVIQIGDHLWMRMKG